MKIKIHKKMTNLSLKFKKYYFLGNIGAVWHCCLNNSFQYLNNNTSDTYFYNIQIHISTTLKTEQQYSNIATKWAHNCMSRIIPKTNLKFYFNVTTQNQTNE